MYYLNEPYSAIVEQVSTAINHPITAQYKKDWIDFFNIAPLSLFRCDNYKFDFITNSEVNLFVDKIMQREHLQQLGINRHTALANRYQYFMQLFRDNLSLMGFSLMLLRKDIEACDPILFMRIKYDGIVMKNYLKIALQEQKNEAQTCRLSKFVISAATCLSSIHEWPYQLCAAQSIRWKIQSIPT